MRLYLLRPGVVPGSGTPFPGYVIQTNGGADVVDTDFPPGIAEATATPSCCRASS